MSTKTLRKRIALVAVSAMGFGLLTSVSANAADFDLTQSASGAGSAGIITALTGNGGTGTMTTDGQLSITTASDATSDAGSITVSGGTFTSITSGGTIDSSRTIVTGVADAGVVGLIVKPSGTGTMLIKSYNSTTRSAATLHSTATITVVAAASVAVLDIAESKANLANIATATATSLTDADITGIDVLGANVVQNDEAGIIVYQLRDANDVRLPATSTVTAESSNPALLVSFDNSFYAQTVAQANTNSYGDVYFAQATSGVPASGTVTLKYNGATVWTKSVTVQGDIASVVLTPVRSTGKTSVAGAITASASAIDATGATATANAGAFTFVVKDSAGNVLGGKTASADSTRYNASVSTITLDDGGVTVKYSATVGLDAGAGLGESLGTWTCTSVAGSSKIRLKATTAAFTTVYSNELDAGCAGDPNSYVASLDKASYVPGDIATLTITAKTSAGTNTYSGAVLGTDTTAELAISGSQLTAVVTPQNEDTFGNTGSKTYKFTVGTTEGSYNMVVDLPKWNVAAGYAGTAQVVSYKVASSSSSVTMAEVLAAIVKLIASINKQITALQKSIKK